MTDAISVGPNVAEIIGAAPEAAESGVTPGQTVEGGVQIDPEAASQEQDAPQGGEELLAGKFKTPDDLVKAYKELESKLGQGAGQAPVAPDSTPEETSSAGSEEEGSEEEGSEEEGSEGPEATQSLDVSGYAQEYAETGELSEASFEALENQGLPRAMVEQYIAGTEAIYQQRGAQLHAAAGGEGEFATLVEWGSNNLPQEQQDAFNTAMSTAIRDGDLTAATMLISAVKSQMGGSEPKLLAATSGAAAGAVKPFADRSEMAEAMRDPRYVRDRAYAEQVQARLAASDW